MNMDIRADQSLVAAAYRMGMANVPKDLSRTFEKMAESYDRTMKQVAATWSEVGQSVGELGLQAAKKAIKNENLNIKGDNYMVYRDEENQIITETQIDDRYDKYVEGQKTDVKPKEILEFKDWVLQDPVKRQGGDAKSQYENYKLEIEKSNKVETKPVLSKDEWMKQQSKIQPVTIGNELRNIRKDLRKLWGKTDAGSRKKRHELKGERDQLIADIQFLENADNFNSDLLTSGNVDFESTGKLNLLMQHALTAYKTKTGVIQDGEFKGFKAVLTRNANDELAFALQDSSGKIVTGINHLGQVETDPNADPFVIDGSETNTLLTPKINPKVKSSIDKLFLAQDTRGAINGTSYLGDKFVNDLRPALEDENVLHAAIRKPLGMNATSFAADLTNESVDSAEIFKYLSTLTSSGSGIASDIVDVPGTSKGITEADFIGEGVGADNYLKVVSAILNRSDKNYNVNVTREAALERYKRDGENMFNEGMRRRKEPGGTTTGTGRNYFIGKQSIPKTSIDPDVKLLNDDPNDIPRRTAWNGVKWKKENGQYMMFNENAEWENLTKDDLAFNLSFDDKVGYISGKSTTTTTTTPPETKTKTYKPIKEQVVKPITQGQEINFDTPIGEYTLRDLFKGNIDDDDVDFLLSKAFPNLQISTPFNLNERINVQGRDYDVNNEMDMQNLVKYLMSEEGQKLLSPEFVVGNEYSRGDKTFIYQKDGTFKEK